MFVPIPFGPFKKSSSVVITGNFTTLSSWGNEIILADVSDVYFFCSGRGNGEFEAAGRGGVHIQLKIPEGVGGGSPGGGAEGPGGCLRGANFFFSGAKMSSK